MKKWLYRILMLICVGVFAFSAYQLYLIYSSSKQVEDETKALQEYVVEENYLQPDWTSLKAENPDIIAWVYFCKPGTDEWYIVYHRINKHYLDKSLSPGTHREVCIDRLEFNEDGTIKRVKLTK